MDRSMSLVYAHRVYVRDPVRRRNYCMAVRPWESALFWEFMLKMVLFQLLTSIVAINSYRAFLCFLQEDPQCEDQAKV